MEGERRKERDREGGLRERGEWQTGAVGCGNWRSRKVTGPAFRFLRQRQNLEDIMLRFSATILKKGMWCGERDDVAEREGGKRKPGGQDAAPRRPWQLHLRGARRVARTTAHGD